VRLYSELAPWFHLLSDPADYAEEAARYRRLIREACPAATTVLELGAGGGNNASHLKRDFTCTLTDLSAEMLALSESINPECEHVAGDMRTIRLGRTFDAVFAHDAIVYMTSEADLRAAVETAYVHTRPGGVALFVPDCTSETFTGDRVQTGGHDGDDGRSLRFLEWTHGEGEDGVYAVDFVVLLREPGRAVRAVHDPQLFGVFPERRWVRVLEDAGFRVGVEAGSDPDGETPQTAFVAVRPPAAAG
jgi:SAM-dependent methyltransferase